jgi:hypothetical protein
MKKHSRRPRTITGLLGLALLGVLYLVVPRADPEGGVAIARFDEWLSALRGGDREGMRRLTTVESRVFVDHLPLDKAGSVPPDIAVHRLERGRAVLRVKDRSPDAVAADGFFVMQREDGEWRVDLMETAGRNAREVDLPGAPTRTRIVPVDGQ